MSYILLFFLIIILFFYLNQYEHFESDNKYVCLYAYYEKNDQYKENLQTFLDKGILDNVDYYFIINGDYTVNIPIKPNIQIIKRKNEGYDFGAWAHCIKNYIKKQYDYYIFLNTSVKGPYLSKETSNNKTWLDKFLELFNTDDVKLVGTSMNILVNTDSILHSTKIKTLLEKTDMKYPPPYTHIQSMFFILNNKGYNFLLNNKFFDDEEILKKSDFEYVIINKEIKMSQLILKNNWNINCILPKYRNHDYRKITDDINPTSINGDPYYTNAYFGETIKPEDVIFFKNNRPL